jgi:hypothetical protein
MLKFFASCLAGKLGRIFQRKSAERSICLFALSGRSSELSESQVKKLFAFEKQEQQGRGKPVNPSSDTPGHRDQETELPQPSAGLPNVNQQVQKPQQGRLGPRCKGTADIFSLPDGGRVVCTRTSARHALKAANKCIK